MSTRFAGCLLLAMMLLSLLSIGNSAFHNTAYALSGLSACLAALILFPNLRTSAKIQVSALFLTGGLLMILAHQRGTSISVVDALSRNTLLLTMLLSVGFLKLLLDMEVSRKKLPRGRKAFLHTLLSLGFFGSVINISAPIMLCDRISQERPIDLFTTRAASRIFCACSAWSPYFAGAALILTLVKDVKLSEVMITGFPLLLISIGVVYWSSIRNDREVVEQFPGYPMSLSKLWLPVALTITVVVTQYFVPWLPILVTISLSALLLTITGLISQLRLSAGFRSLATHVIDGLPSSANELILFLSAGVLATGLTAFVEASQFQLSLSSYSYPAACATLALMIVIAAMGIHPIIQISAFTPLVLPIQPDTELLASTYLFAWALGTTASPLSGTHMVFQGRYGIPAWKGATQNWLFVCGMYCVSICLMGLQVWIS